MRTTLTLNDELMADAAAYSGIDDKSKIINLALNTYIKSMAAKRLVALGGTMPDLVVPPRNASRLADDFSPAKEAAMSLAATGGTMPDFGKVAEPPARYATGKSKKPKG
jgi:hypothetical protein